MHHHEQCGFEVNSGGRGFVPQLAAQAVREITGANQAEKGDRWRSQGVAEHLAHLRAHLDHYEQGDTSEQHLKHLATRALFALEIALTRGERT